MGKHVLTCINLDYDVLARINMRFHVLNIC